MLTIKYSQLLCSRFMLASIRSSGIRTESVLQPPACRQMFIVPF